MNCAECDRELRSDNRSGYCQEHKHLSKYFAEYRRARRLRVDYGINEGHWQAMLARAGHRCEVCGATEDLCVDHHHETSQIRGVLCRRCNRCIGQLGDTLEVIRAALEYLLKYERSVPMYGIPCPKCHHEGPHEKVESARDGSYRTLLCDRCHLEWRFSG